MVVCGVKRRKTRRDRTEDEQHELDSIARRAKEKAVVDSP